MNVTPSTNPNFNRWTHQESTHQIDVSVRKQIFSHFLETIDLANTALELEIKKQSENVSLNNHVIEDLMYGGAKLEQLRATFGAVRYEVAQNLQDFADVWDTLNDEKIRQTMSGDVRFSIDILRETINRTHGQDLSDFNNLWNSIQKNKAVKYENPIDIFQFCKLVYLAQLKQEIKPALQNMMFLQIEQELVQSLGFLLFDINNRLSDMGVRLERKNNEITEKDKSSTFSLSDGDSVGSVNDETLFNTLCDLLKTWEPTPAEIAAAGAASGRGETYTGDHLRALNNQEIFSVLSTLQQWVPKVLEDALGHPDGRLGSHIKESMIKQAEALGVPEGQTKISIDDEYAVDLVDEVFTKNLYERKIQAASRTVMAQILFPSVKAAILNRRWFSEETHPARKFISSVTDACVPENGDVREDMMQKALETVNKLVAGFNEDVSIFEILAQEIQKYSELRETNSEHQKNDVSKRSKIIKDELEKSWKNWSGPSPVKKFALELGVEHLIFLEQKNLRDSIQWFSAIGTLNSLMSLKSSIGIRVKIDGTLRNELMKMLLSCGWTGVRAHNRLAEQEDAIHAYYVLGQTNFEPYTINNLQAMFDDEMKEIGEHNIIDQPKLFETYVSNKNDFEQDMVENKSDLTSKPIENIKNTELKNENISCENVTTKNEIQKNQKISEKSKNIPESVSSLQKKVNAKYIESSIIEDVMLSKIMALEIGSMSTWINSHDEMVVVKLSWISPISMKYLFVNKTGARILVGTPKDLTEISNKGRFFPGTTP